MHETINVPGQNPQMTLPRLSLAEAQADLPMINALRPRLARLQRLTEQPKPPMKRRAATR